MAFHARLEATDAARRPAINPSPYLPARGSLGGEIRRGPRGQACRASALPASAQRTCAPIGQRPAGRSSEIPTPEVVRKNLALRALERAVEAPHLCTAIAVDRRIRPGSTRIPYLPPHRLVSRKKARPERAGASRSATGASRSGCSRFAIEPGATWASSSSARAWSAPPGWCRWRRSGGDDARPVSCSDGPRRSASRLRSPARHRRCRRTTA